MFDALSALKHLGVKYITHGKNVSANWLAINCPYCNDKGYHGGIPYTGTHFYCWKCGGHPLIQTLEMVCDLSYYEINNILEEYSNRGSAISLVNRKRASGSNLVLPGEDLSPMHIRYLKKRGFDPDILVDIYGIKGTGITGEWRYRIMIPIYYHGELVSWQGRDITGQQELRYKTLSVEKSVVDPKSILFGIDDCKEDFIGVCEGAFDRFKLGSNFVATLGTSMRESQFRMLCNYKKVVFVFDPEGPAQKRAMKAADKVSALGGNEVYVVNTGLDHDPGDMTEKEVQILRKTIDFD